MRPSARAEYACLALIELARPEGGVHPRTVRSIAEARGVPERYLIHVLLQLKSAGLVYSMRGPVGGYVLARDPESISVAEVVSAIDGPDAPSRLPPSPVARALAEVLDQARAAGRRILREATIAELAGCHAASV
jgi:Rrf2 family protein